MASDMSLTDIATRILSAAEKYPKDPPNTYPPPPELTSQKLHLITLAKSLIFELMDGGMMTQAHSLQMAELVSIRSLMGMKVFEALPEKEGEVVSLEELSSTTGVEGKLLERLLRVCVGTGFVTQKKLQGKKDGEGGLEDYGYGHSKFSRAYGSYPGLFFKLMCVFTQSEKQDSNEAQQGILVLMIDLTGTTNSLRRSQSSRSM